MLGRGFPSEGKRKLFGEGGSVSEILGKIGDALLLANGLPMYHKQEMDRRAVAEAMQGFTEDPLAAIERLAQKQPELAQKYYNDYLDSQAKSATAAEAKRGHDITERDNVFDRDMKLNETIGGLLNRANADNYTLIRDRAKALAKAYNSTIADTLPENWDERSVRDWAISSMPVKDQENINYRNDRLSQFDRGLDIQEGRSGEIARHNRETEDIQRKNTEISRDRARVYAETSRNKKGIARPATVGTTTKPFRVPLGPDGKPIPGAKIQVRQADGSYK
jgi:hypothetical protein